jgi:hypothetical protein
MSRETESRYCGDLEILTNQSIIVWTLKDKSLLPSLYKREEFPLFEKEGLGEIFTTICLFNYGLLSKREEEMKPLR